MTDECISPLRRRMIEDMTVRNFVPQQNPSTFGASRTLPFFLAARPIALAGKMSATTCCIWHTFSGSGVTVTHNETGSALRFFFDVTLDRADIVRHLPIAREPRKAPIVLSPEEVARMLEAAPGLEYKAALSVAYGAGLRVSESRCAQGERYRQRADDDPDRAEQAPQGPLRDAVAAAARAAARLVAGVPLAGLAVPGP